MTRKTQGNAIKAVSFITPLKLLKTGFLLTYSLYSGILDISTRNYEKNGKYG